MRKYALVAALLLPQTALAGTVVLAPLLARTGAKPQHVSNVTSLISSELDFMSEFDDVVELTASPANTACLTTPSCLRVLANQGGGDALLTGALSVSATQFTIELVYYDNKGGSIVRHKTYTLASDPEAVADGMNDVVTSLVTGKTRTAAKDAEPGADAFAFDLEDGDDFSFEDSKPSNTSSNAAAALARSQAAERERAERERAAEEARRAEEQRRVAEEQRQRQEAEARTRAESEARARAEAQANARAAEEQRRRDEQQAAYARNTAEVFDPSAITFGKPADDDITMEALNSAINFRSPVADVAVEPARPSRSTGPIDDLDELDEPRRPTTPPSTRTPSKPTHSQTTRSPSSSDVPSVQFALRMGYSKYFALSFVTWGGEIAIPAGTSGLTIVGGVEAFSTQRQIPLEQQPIVERISEWNTIFPLSGGVQYKFRGDSAVTPYVGADLVAVQYYVNTENQPAWAIGGRGRGGIDIAVSPVVAVNVNVSVGAWQGSEWWRIEEGMENVGPLPQLSAGTIFSF